MPSEPGSPDPRSTDGAIAASLGDIRSSRSEPTESVERAAHRGLLHEENQRLRHDERQAALDPVRTARRAGLIRGGKVVRRAEMIVARAPVGGD
jgi:hypothetical protein